MLLFTTLLTVFAAVASSLIPALRATRGRPNDVLKDEARGATGLRVGRFSRALVVAQVALSFGLLMASGLVIKSIVNTTLISIPFRTDVLTGRLDLSGPAYKDDAALRADSRAHPSARGGGAGRCVGDVRRQRAGLRDGLDRNRGTAAG